MRPQPRSAHEYENVYDLRMLAPGTVVGGDYRVERKLSEGGMGAVFVAEQLSTGAKRALKIIRPELLHEVKLRVRFEQEAKVTAKIASDHVVSVVAAGFDTNENVPWLAMELLSGETLLHAVQERGSLPRGVVLAVLKQLAHAMDAAHAAGVVHRDLKPENVFLADARRTGVPFFLKVLDFGIARVVRDAQMTGADMLGTPLWMAPEQTGMGDSVGPWTDVWSLGLIVFYLLTGRSYWLAANGEGSTFGIMREICVDDLVPASERAKALGCERAIPDGFDPWFARCVTRDVKARFDSFGAAVGQLEGMLEGKDGGATADALATTEAIVSSKPASSKPISVKASTAAPVASPASLAQPTPGIAPEAVSITNHARPTPSKRRWRNVVLGVAGVAFFVVGFLAFRAVMARKDAELCRGGETPEACDRACSSGDVYACTRLAVSGVGTRDVNVVARSVDTLRRACAADDGEACGALGRARAFPPSPAIPRDVPDAVALLERGCEKGHACALLGALKNLGWPGIAKDAPHYFGAACREAPRSAEALLDCHWAVAAEAEGPPKRPNDRAPISRAATNVAGKSPLALCKERGGDACALGWLAKDVAPKDLKVAYERGCDTGSTLACNNLAAMRAEGFPGLDPNPVAARELFERACAAGEVVACNNVAFVLGGLPVSPRWGPRGARLYKLRCGGPFQVGCVGWGERRDVVPRGTPADVGPAVAALERACKDGLTTACVNLGAFLYLGRGIARDRARAEKLFAESCFRGDASACGEQGAALLTLRMDHPKDAKAGLGFLERACTAGEEDACAALYAQMLNDPKREKDGAAGLERLAARDVFSHTLAQLFETGGVHVAKKPEEARRIALRMCESESRCLDAAYYLSKGIGGPKEERRAFEALTRGCDEEDFASCAELGARYREGRGVSRDPSRAVDLFSRACNGDAAACDALSRAHLAGEGVPKDLVRALALGRIACEGGNADGCASVGVMIADGLGTTKDPNAAGPYLSFGCRRAVHDACAKLTALGLPIPDLDL